MAEILTVPTITTISYEVLANEAWREKEPGDFARAVLHSLAINDGKEHGKNNQLKSCLFYDTLPLI